MSNDEDYQFVFRINDNNTGPNLLHQVCLERGWKIYENFHSTNIGWNLWWRTKGFPIFCHQQLQKEQFTNHIPNASFICRKDNLVRCLKCMKKIYGSSYDFVPIGFNLPLEYKKLIAYCKSNNELQNDDNVDKREIWICKPVGLSQGRGISIFQDPGDLVYSSNVIVQRYVKNPLLIGGYKFDLRLYVLVPSFHPLTVYIYREGLVRFGTEKFSLSNLKNRFAHLTNSSLNKFGPGYLETKERVGAGCKWSLRQLRCYLQQRIGSDWFLWQHISTMIVLTVVSQLSKIPFTANCFEFYGFDVLIDDQLKPWLIEVNLSPALSVDCSLDCEIKKNMMHDMFDLIGLPVTSTGLQYHTFDAQIRSSSGRRYRPRSESVIKASIKWREKRLKSTTNRTRNRNHRSFSQGQNRPTRHRTVSEQLMERNSSWSNGKNWHLPDSSEGNWVRVYPQLLEANNRIRFSRSAGNVHRTFNTDEIRQVVSSVVSFLKIAKEVFEANPNAENEYLNACMTVYLRSDAKIWVPPLE